MRCSAYDAEKWIERKWGGRREKQRAGIGLVLLILSPRQAHRIMLAMMITAAG